MCNPACLAFVQRTVQAVEIARKLVLEVGARDVNGSVRPAVEALKPKRYVGVDIEAGPRVDYVCDAVNLIDQFGEASFHTVLTTEMLEHVEDWRAVLHNLKGVLKPGGVLFLTTRSRGFPYHGYPHDYWRYEVADMQVLFADMDILELESDPSEPGVFLKARKPEAFQEADLSAYKLFSIRATSEPEVPPAPPVEWPSDPEKPPHQWGIA